ncbi:DEAD/DEAH box helicase [Parahaliea sp. F7430]|uniref:DEAD/DEAH box helicase n=1 Tax=Sediminihaliea albiluteola TaxID=2758564 RepID=A0A7W2YL99_9GAMM|nr:DEAD/DEAH box helicase [Sediminihaliea albiluteola]MBA6414183.1 DEAD/DEAH box helicase [Sediminihaliea albiluteola]
MIDLQQLLGNYSEGELAAILGEGVLEMYKRTTGQDVTKEVLMQSVVTLYGHELLTNSSMRTRLIESMNQEQVKSLFLCFCEVIGEDIKNEDNIDFYETLKNFSELKTIEFAELFGVSIGEFSAEKNNTSVDGIVKLDPAYPMYPYQGEMVEKILSLMQGGEKKRCILHLPTGAGKTRTAMNVASEHLRREKKGLVLWLADTAELCSQAANEFKKAWTALGDRQIKLYSYYSDTNISLGGIDQGFLVAGLQKLHAARDSQNYKILYEQLQSHVTLIIFDEAHKAIAPTYKTTVNHMINANYNTFLLGLSATPGRQLEVGNDEDAELAKFFDNSKITMRVAGYQSPVKYLVDEQYLAKAEFVPIDYDGISISYANEFSNSKRSNEIRQALSEDGARNKKLLEVIEKAHEQGSSIIVFACSVDHSLDLASMLSFRGIKAFSLDSKNDDASSRRYKISEYLKGNVRVIINYNILTTGFDAPRTNVAIIARPTDSLVQYSQMAGRAMRGKKSGGNEKCTIYTVRDDIPVFRSVIDAFMHWDNIWNEV